MRQPSRSICWRSARQTYIRSSADPLPRRRIYVGGQGCRRDSLPRLKEHRVEVYLAADPGEAEVGELRGRQAGGSASDRAGVAQIETLGDVDRVVRGERGGADFVAVAGMERDERRQRFLRLGRKSGRLLDLFTAGQARD